MAAPSSSSASIYISGVALKASAVPGLLVLLLQLHVLLRLTAATSPPTSAVLPAASANAAQSGEGSANNDGDGVVFAATFRRRRVRLEFRLRIVLLVVSACGLLAHCISHLMAGELFMRAAAAGQDPVADCRPRQMHRLQEGEAGNDWCSSTLERWFWAFSSFAHGCGAMAGAISMQSALRAKGIASGARVSVNYAAISRRLRDMGLLALASFAAVAALGASGTLSGLALAIRMETVPMALAMLSAPIAFYKYHWPLRKQAHQLPPEHAKRLLKSLNRVRTVVRAVLAWIVVASVTAIVAGLSAQLLAGYMVFSLFPTSVGINVALMLGMLSKERHRKRRSRRTKRSASAPEQPPDADNRHAQSDTAAMPTSSLGSSSRGAGPSLDAGVPESILAVSQTS